MSKVKRVEEVPGEAKAGATAGLTLYSGELADEVRASGRRTSDPLIYCILRELFEDAQARGALVEHDGKAWVQVMNGELAELSGFNLARVSRAIQSLERRGRIERIRRREPKTLGIRNHYRVKA